MSRITAMFMVISLLMSTAACTTRPGEVGEMPRKVADQRLAAYNPIRRLIYRNACGSEGPLTVCVDRITLSDGAALVEARIRNNSPQKYIQGVTRDASVFLADDTGMKLSWSSEETIEYPGLEERNVRFRMEGHFSGEPYAVMVSSIRKKQAEQTGDGFTIVAMLGQ